MSESRQPLFCASGGDDAVRDVFCVDPPPAIRSLFDLQILLDLRPSTDRPEPQGALGDAYYTLSSVTVLGHSSALSGHLVSSINPRAIVMSPDTFLAFQRGVQRVEIITRGRDSGLLQFYLLDFEQPCNRRERGCTHGDLYTPRIESDWQRVVIRSGEELANTPQDCRTCHQRNTETPKLLMRELETPWTHFFLPPSTIDSPGVSGSDLFSDYVEAKGDELYAAFAIQTISAQGPFFLENVAGPAQPLYFDAPKIEYERHPYGPDGYVKEPQSSPTWERAYEAFKRGEQLALPYVATRASDAEKLAARSGAYQRYRAGEIDADDLPDLADVFPDDGLERARRGLQTEPDAPAEDALIQACASCHNDVLDQSISRARFNVRVSSLDRRELDRAIERLKLPRTADGAMPPLEARQLDAATRERLIDYLGAEPSELDPDGKLDEAARLGMMGGSGQRITNVNAL